jgi:hypothetical protein
LGKWDFLWLIAAGGALVGGTLVVRFVPDFYYRRISFPWGRTLSGIAVAIGGLLTLSALHSVSDWGWWQWLGAGILVVSGIIYVLLPDFQREKFRNRKFSIVKAWRGLNR